MVKQAVGIEQKGSKLYNIQNLTAFWAYFSKSTCLRTIILPKIKKSTPKNPLEYEKIP